MRMKMRMKALIPVIFMSVSCTNQNITNDEKLDKCIEYLIGYIEQVYERNKDVDWGGYILVDRHHYAFPYKDLIERDKYVREIWSESGNYNVHLVTNLDGVIYEEDEVGQYDRSMGFDSIKDNHAPYDFYNGEYSVLWGGYIEGYYLTPKSYKYVISHQPSASPTPW